MAAAIPNQRVNDLPKIQSTESRFLNHKNQCKKIRSDVRLRVKEMENRINGTKDGTPAGGALFDLYSQVAGDIKAQITKINALYLASKR